MRGCLKRSPLRGPHLMLTNAGRHDELAGGDGRKPLENVLRQNHVVALFIKHRIAGAPLIDLRVPLAPVLGEGPEVDRSQERLHVAVDWYMGEFILIDLGGVDIHVHDLPVLGELGELAGHAVVEPHA